MRWMKSRYWAGLMVFFLIFSVFPLSMPVVRAATSSGYFTISSFSTDMNNPTTVNVPQVDISGTFSSQVVGSSITYTLQQIVNGQAVQTNTSAQAPSISQQTFTFKTVTLFPGLNKITIQGKNTSGNLVESDPGSAAYVYFANVPIIYDVKQIDGTAFDSIVYVDEAVTNKRDLSFTLRAPNADSVTVNGIVAVSGGQDLYIASGIPLQLGLNDITIVAKNASQTYTVKRQAVFFNGQTSYGLTAGPDVSKNSNVPQPLEGNPVLGPTVFDSTNNTYSLAGDLKGHFILTESATSGNPSVQLDLFDVTQGGGSIKSQTVTPSTSTVVDSYHRVYDYTAAGFFDNPSSPITSGHSYKIRATVTYAPGQTTVIEYPFVYRDPSSTYIKEGNLLYGVAQNSSGTYTYSSKSTANPSFDVFEAPITFGFVLGNPPSTSPTVTIKNVQDGGVNSQTFSLTAAKTYDGSMYVVPLQASQLYPGLQTVTITIGSDSRTYRINYVPAPTIQLTNVYNGQVFKNAGDLSSIQARFSNFTDTEIKSTQVYINQTQVDSAQFTKNSQTGLYELSLASPAPQLQPGANTILVHGEASGIPIEINLNVFVFSDDVPKITDISLWDKDFINQNTVTIKKTGDNKYVTNDRVVYLWVSYANLDSAQVQIDGVNRFGDAKIVATNATYVDPASSTSTDSALNYMRTVSDNTGTYMQLKVTLKSAGSTNVTIIGRKNGVPAMTTVEIVREVPPYTIVSPELPKQRVVNQNFWYVKIKAEQVDSVTINKSNAEPVLGEPDTFGLEVKNLRPGKNTIKFTINRPANPISGSFDIYYANQNTIGAQYKTLIGSGTLSAFNKGIEIKLPRGTLFRNLRFVAGTEDNSVPYLFDQQQVRFGIASQGDATVEPRASITNTGKVLIIDPLTIGQYMFAGPLYWVDGGYYDDSSSIFKPVDGLDPYTPGSEFYSGRRWLKPTQRGTITLKYDEALRDVVGNNLTVWRFFNNQWQNVGGVVDAGKKTITAPFNGFGYYTVAMLRRGYSDITAHPWAREYLETMLSKGIMLPKSNDAFGVYDNVTRGEFAQIMVKALDLPLQYDPNNLTFYDVPNVVLNNQPWDYRYIETAFRKGIVRGLAPGVYNPYGNLSRQEAAVMIARAINAKVGGDGAAAQRAMARVFTDSQLIDYYASPSVLAINKLGIINGEPNQLIQGQKKQTFSFNPNAPLSRAEAAKIAFKMMQYLKKLPK